MTGWLRNPQFACGGAALCERLAREFPARRYAVDEVLVTAGDPVQGQLVLLEGVVRCFHRSAGGPEALVKMLSAPATLGEMELLHDLPFLANVAALRPSLVATIPRHEYLDLLARHPEVAIEQLRNLAGPFCVAARNELQVMAALDVRVANLLVSFAEVDGQVVAEGVPLEVDVSCQRIADGLGVTRRGVLKVLAKWRQAGILGREGPTLQLLRPEELVALARPLSRSLTYHIGKPLAGTWTPANSPPRGKVEVVGGPRPCLGRTAHVHQGLLVGRSAECALLLPDETVDPRHCQLYLASTGGRYWVEDLGSLNGTLVNGRLVRHRRALHAGDEIQVGATRLAFSIE